MTCTAALCIAASLITTIDGDTFKVGPQSFRLWGINAVEIDEPGGQRAKVVLGLIINKHQGLACERKGTSFDRIVVRCDVQGGPVSGADLGCLMVAAGSAEGAPRFSRGRYRGCGE